MGKRDDDEGVHLGFSPVHRGHQPFDHVDGQRHVDGEYDKDGSKEMAHQEVKEGYGKDEVDIPTRVSDDRLGREYGPESFRDGGREWNTQRNRGRGRR
jgi:hypothetical protein